MEIFVISWFIAGFIGVLLYFIGMLCFDKALYFNSEIFLQIGYIYLFGYLGLIFSAVAFVSHVILKKK